MRNLLIFILVLVVIWWVRRALSKPRDGDPRAGGSRRGGPKNPPEPMLACDQCGVHVPESEGVHDDDGFFCCEEHRRLGVRH
ncbi:PP0621 family protein [Azoarcus sp. PA01]|nr:PP0621 family protein [Azoarcus sp. PA01]